MFREGDLLRSAKDINISNNRRLHLEQPAYQLKTDVKNIRSYGASISPSPMTTQFHVTQQTAPIPKIEEYSDWKSYQRTASRTGVPFFKGADPVTNIVKNINKLQLLGERNWSYRDMKYEKSTSSLSIRPMTAASIKKNFSVSQSAIGGHKHSLSHKQLPSIANKTVGALMTPHYETVDAGKSNLSIQRIGGQKHTISCTPSPLHSGGHSLNQTVRTFSPQLSSYIETPAQYENIAQKITYMSLRGSCTKSTNLIGSKRGSTNSYPFENLVENMSNMKAYGVSNQSGNNGWKDMPHDKKIDNHQASNFHIISHSHSNPHSLKHILTHEPRACYKVKGISEYNDLTRVTAAKPNIQYQSQINKNPFLFRKSSGHCANVCDFGKTYGPNFQFFRK